MDADASLPVSTVEIQRHARRPRRKAHAPRERSMVEAWAFDPVSVLRLALVATYVDEVWIAVNALRAGVPSFFVVGVVDWFTPLWAWLLIAAALVATVGAITDRLHRIEQWACLGVAALAFAYVLAINIVGWTSDPLRQTPAAVTILMVILPLTRFGYFVAHVGKAPAA